ncbi:MAG: sodium-dependent transporter [Alphaproteobacteria bacterium]|nr:sodium-dependent transporter [Alphaproteobacteria bacterium]
MVHETWSNRAMFILAAVGSAVGLGNIWRFPYLAGENGGGAFVLVYLACVLGIGLPVLIAELIIGRRGRCSAVASARSVARESGASGGWAIVGWLGILAAVLILSYYSVIGGWLVAYVPITATGTFTGADAAAVSARFGAFLADPWVMTGAHAVFMAITVGLVAQGVRKGIEAAVRVLMPALFLLLVLLVVFAMVEGAFGEALAFLFVPDFSAITFGVVIEAIGQAFFSLSIGMGAMITYGAYLDRDTSIPASALTVAGADTLVAILAGLAIFPIVFAAGLDPSGGPGLLFQSLPFAFGQMPFGALVGTLFFLFSLFAALTSSIALLEIVVSWAEEHRGWPRAQATLIVGAISFVLGLATVLSFNRLSGFAPLGFLPGLEGKTIFDLLDLLTNNIMLPVGGILIALLAGWVMKQSVIAEEYGAGVLRGPWYLMLRYVAPVAIGLVLVFAFIA